MTALLTIESVSVHYPLGTGWFGRRRLLRAVEDVSLTIGEGETLALVGESGSGKTTLGRVAAALRAPTRGRVRLRGEEIGPGSRAAARAIQIVFQDPVSSLDPRMPVAEIVTEPLRIQWRASRSERIAAALELMDQVGLPRDAVDRYPHEFSGGQRQRIAIARALAPEPGLIVADEPLSSLDVSVQSQILNLMRDVQERRRLSYLFISHDLGVVDHLADRIAVLYLGRVAEIAPRADLFSRPAHPYTRTLIEAMPRVGRGRRRHHAVTGEIPSPLAPPPGCVFHTRCPLAVAHCRSVPPRLEPVAGRPTHQAACHFKD